MGSFRLKKNNCVSNRSDSPEIFLVPTLKIFLQFLIKHYYIYAECPVETNQNF